MRTLRFASTFDLPFADHARALMRRAEDLNYAISLRDAHAVWMAWRETHGTQISTDDGRETVAPPLPSADDAFVRFLLSVCVETNAPATPT